MWHYVTTKILASSLALVASVSSAVADDVVVQRPDASGPVVGGLKWTLAGKYARIQGDKLVVEIPESAHPADAIAVAELPKGIYDGMEGLSFSVRVKGEGIAKPTQPWLGLKCQIHVQEPGGESYANGDADGVVGDFDETISSDVSFKTPRPGRVMLNLGLQGTSGKAVFDLSTLRCGRIDGRFAHVKGNFLRVNGDKRVSYPTRVMEDRRRRGVMLPGREPTKDDFKTLADWGVTLVRYQMVGAPKGKDADLGAYDRWLDGKLSVLEKVVLPEARKYGMKVVVDLHAAPGGYDKVRGMAMLRGGKYAEAFVDLWRRIATRFRGNEDVIYGYDLVNEPNQSRRAAIDYWTIQRKAAEAIREIDRETTIIVESNGWGVPSTYSYMSPLALDNVIYQVHCYEPMDFTHQGIAGRPCGASWPDKSKGRDRDFLRRQLAPVREFEKRHGAKIYVGEFSAAAWAKGAENYIADMIAICEEYGWDWTYHAFREYKGWSVEHEATSPDDIRPSNGNPRKSVLLDGLRRTTPGVVSFKDAAKIKSWDAWNDHKGPQAKKERRSVTWEKLQKLDSGLEPYGFLATRSASEIKSSKWSIGCETMDRDYADWDQFKQYVGMLGAKHGRLFSGWAKTEQEKGVYDFTWLDPQVREMAAMGVKPWICLSYGNPVYGSDFRLGMRVRQVTDKPEAFDAWIRYCTACVERYKDVVDEWEVWNEPFGQGPEYAEMFYRTAKAIRAVQPKSKIFCTAVNMKADYVCVLEKLKKENALDLGSYFIYHPYVPVPEWPFVSLVKPLRDLVKSYSPDFDVMQGECGCPAQLEFEHAMHSIEWTEYSQAKWNLRHVVGDAVRNVPCSVFTMIDLQYTFMLQSFGMLRSNTLKEVVYRRPSFYAMQHVFSYFDDDVRAVSVGDVDHGGRKITVARFERNSVPVYVMWFSGKRPDDTLAYEPTTFEIHGEAVKNPVWADLLTGKVGKLSDANVSAKDGKLSFMDLPLWDSPVMVTDDSQVPRRRGAEPVRLLVIGNSLVRHGVAPKLGWTNDWGMAASAREKDFAHLVASGIERWTGRHVELRLHDTKGLEFNYRTYDVHKDLDGKAQWRPDYVVFSAGENIKAFTNETESATWRDDLVQAGRLLKSANPEANIVFKTTFWCVPEKNREIVAAAKAVGGAVADIGTRGNDRRNQAVGLFKHGGVACHPGDAGMKMIAEKVLLAFGFPEPQHELPPAK